MAESVWETPFESHDNPAGFSLDVGGSTTKVLFRSKEDCTNGLPNTPSNKLTLRLQYWPRNDVQGLLIFLRENCDIVRESDEGAVPTAYLTGIGIKENEDEINSVLGVKTTILPEFDCFSKAVATLINTLPLSDVFHPLRPTECVPALKSIKAYTQTMLSLSSIGSEGLEGFPTEVRDAFEATIALHDVDALVKSNTERPVTWPLTLTIGGSSFTFMTLNQCGQYKITDISSRGGRTLLGLAKLVLGTTDYNEIAEMASRGNPNNIDSMGGDLIPRTSIGENIYAAIPNDMLVFALGRLCDSNYDGRYNKDDIAAGLFKLIVMDLVQLTDLNAVKEGTKCIILSGSFFNHPYVRALVNQQMLTRLTTAQVAAESRKYFKIIKYTGHMGAIGCWMKAASFKARKASHD